MDDEGRDGAGEDGNNGPSRKLLMMAVSGVMAPERSH